MVEESGFDVWKACIKASSDYVHMSHMGGAASLPLREKLWYKKMLHKIVSESSLDIPSSSSRLYKVVNGRVAKHSAQAYDGVSCVGTAVRRMKSLQSSRPVELVPVGNDMCWPSMDRLVAQLRTESGGAQR